MERIGAMCLAAALCLLPAFARAEGVTLQDISRSAKSTAELKIFTAKKIITMEPSNPEAVAVAVSGKRIVAVGSLEQVKQSLGDLKFTVDNTFADHVLVPGLIDQHLHPVLGMLTLAVEVIAPEDWVLPDRTYKAVGSPEEYLKRLKEGESTYGKPGEWFFTWGYHQLWHGEIDRAVLDKINPKFRVHHAQFLA